MNLEDFVAISGLSGIYRLVANRNNGLVVADLDSGKKKFAPSRKHQFTPLASIGIFTMTDTEELSIVFKTMLEQLESNPPVSPKSSAEDIVDYFKGILPEFDRDRVNTSDIRKVIKWFNFLNERELLSLTADEEKKEEGVEEAGEKKETETASVLSDDPGQAVSDSEESE